MENDVPRMVKTPWSEEEIPFEVAAEVGTKKVITEHSTIGILVTTDGSITEIPREDYIETEERVVRELKELNKPFVIVLNTNNPYSDYCKELSRSMEEKYGCRGCSGDSMRRDLCQLGLHRRKQKRDADRYPGCGKGDVR